ncbi:hypothetical protein Tsubulata_018292, partial [Turnera subulata]
MHSKLYQTTSKLKALARSGSISHARKLFDEMPKRDTVAWNTMVTAYSQLGLHHEALSLFHQMRTCNVAPDHYTLTATLNACAGSGLHRNGTKIHALAIVLGYQSSLPVSNSVIDMYGKCLNPSGASKVFGEMSKTNDISWCSLLFAYTNSGRFHEARDIFSLMPMKTGIACNILIAELFYGCMIHATIVRSGWSSAAEAKNSILSFYAKLGSLDDALKTFESPGMLTIVSWNAMIDAYMKAGDTGKALTAFQQVPEKNAVSWTSMITGCARNGQVEEAFNYFVGMMRNCLRPDHFTFGAVLHACSSLAALGLGRMVHGSLIHYGFCSYVYIGNCLIDMYAKCGDLDASVRAFGDIYEKDLVSLNAMLFAFGLHGKASQAIKLYEDMVANGMKPDKVTFTGLLMTCSHSGLIDKGRQFFESMRSDHGLTFDMDHVACMVDMLGRGGHFAEAKEVANSCLDTGKLDGSTLEALLGACSAQGELGMATSISEALMVLEPRKEMSYVLQSNLYCANGRWKEAEMVRKTMVDEGLNKHPGCSWIEVNDKVTAFVSGNHSLEELCRLLYSLQFEMRNP